MKKLLSVLLCIILLALPSAAHSGRTDSHGGHTDHSTGEYHYHHGKPAHQHPGGVCPYDHSSKKTESSGQSSTSSGEVVASGKHGRLVRISDTPELEIGYMICDAKKKETTTQQTSPDVPNSTYASAIKAQREAAEKEARRNNDKKVLKIVFAVIYFLAVAAVSLSSTKKEASDVFDGVVIFLQCALMYSAMMIPLWCLLAGIYTLIVHFAFK